MFVKKNKKIVVLMLIMVSIVMLFLFVCFKSEKSLSVKQENKIPYNNKVVTENKIVPEQRSVEPDKNIVSPNLYENKELGIRIKIMEGWSIEVDTSSRKNDHLNVYLIKPKQQENCAESGYCADVIFVGINENKENKTLQEYLNDKHDNRIISQESPTTNGLHRLVVNNLFDGAHQTEYWKDLNGDKFFFIEEGYLSDSQKDDFEKIVNDLEFFIP
ncbi:hypothetical protein HN784_04425 [bacterium]|jgi:hypothetical protein|nr:hypothetical protein [bacterium]MBT4251421.1 hypothetical protein [bacterium]MBT7037560.1 hypothetical protein [bacterium]MBT7432062.1 hypothetical protein [bacterium]MBT7992934.1 hypothetical protein [bacterium]